MSIARFKLKTNLSQSQIAALEYGEKYNWVNQPERLVYLGKLGVWHQFALVKNTSKFWCEVLDEDLHMIEKK